MNLISKKSVSFFLVFVLYLSMLLISIIKPPFQSPDEFEHYKRTISLMDGQFLQSVQPETNKSGVFISNDYLLFISKYSHLPFNVENKINYNWSGGPFLTNNAELIFTPSPGTGPYAPILYGFQGSVNMIIEYFSGDLLLNYKYVSFANATLFFIILIWMVHSQSINILPILFVTSAPLFMFQIVSWSLDSIFFSITVIVIYLLLLNKFTSGLLMVTTIVAAAKISFITIFLPLFFNMKTKLHIFLFFIGVFFVAAWTLYAAVNNPGLGDVGLGRNLHNFNQDPVGVVGFLLSEIFNFSRIFGQLKMSVGSLGWLDYATNNMITSWYHFLFIALCLFCFSSIFMRGTNQKSILIAAILMWPLINVLVGIFTTDLSNHKFGLIGIQGRYFYPVLIIFSLWLGFNYKKSIDSHHFKLSLICILTIIYSCYSTVFSTIERYY